MHGFLKFIFGIKLYFSDISSVHHQEFFIVHTIQHWYMSYRFADSLLAGSGRNSVLILLASCQKTCIIYINAVCTMKNS